MRAPGRGCPQGRALAPGGWATVIGNNLALHLPAGSLELAPVGVGGVLIYREKKEKKGLRADGALSSFLMISELSAPRRSHFYSVTLPHVSQSLLKPCRIPAGFRSALR